MNNCVGKQIINETYYYNGREVIIVKCIQIMDMVIIKFKDKLSEIRSVKYSCLDTTNDNYKSLKFIRVSQLAKLY